MGCNRQAAIRILDRPPEVEREAVGAVMSADGSSFLIHFCLLCVCFLSLGVFCVC